jgi:hypothetical protein
MNSNSAVIKTHRAGCHAWFECGSDKPCGTTMGCGTV